MRRPEDPFIFISFNKDITMAKGKKSSKPRAAGKRRGYGRRRAGKVRNVNDYASLSVTRSLTQVNSGQLYFFNDIQLADFQRAVQVAQGYQKFRISGVTLMIKPNLDSYISVAAGSPQKPYLYYMIDKSASIPLNVTLEGLKQMGAKPIALDERPVKMTWKPAVLTADALSPVAIGPSQYKVSPWLSTNANTLNPGAWVPSSVAHQGIKFFIEQVGQLTQFNLEIQLQFEFAKPLLPALAAISGTSLTYAEIDASPDGIVGGSDGMSIPLPSPSHA